ncbi:MAG TPA: crossover junction endodeoxyribonuclease RuvC [Bdellovibrionales bacterium]|nr:crossover junction endodeoxyribonuclease RuvC [Bdellovibrionales bacterium]
MAADIVIGLDPGSRRTGYGVIAVQGDRFAHVAHGVIELKGSWPMPERWRVLQLELSGLFAKHPARVAVVEKIFFGKSADSAFKLGHARGVCLLAAAQVACAVEEYAARYVKKAITGNGAADKEHVQKVIFNLLRISPRTLAFDASDALSLAVTHAMVRDVNARLKKALENSP